MHVDIELRERAYVDAELGRIVYLFGQDIVQRVYALDDDRLSAVYRCNALAEYFGTLQEVEFR